MSVALVPRDLINQARRSLTNMSGMEPEKKVWVVSMGEEIAAWVIFDSVVCLHAASGLIEYKCACIQGNIAVCYSLAEVPLVSRNHGNSLGLATTALDKLMQVHVIWILDQTGRETTHQQSCTTLHINKVAPCYTSTMLHHATHQQSSANNPYILPPATNYNVNSKPIEKCSSNLLYMK